ncbi:ATP-binding protein [Burkholderia sp. L27(2015)]|uniref:ATP-binding protein n=1 Tax=Burkholderia sp. L27(2015) TaxID=1641858 RepID=UPI00131C4561|nr:ATP-binding protein [Burkholderia sp. L27(2015)]
MKVRLWPDTLFGRLALILVVGMFGGQVLTSTIWFEAHDNRTLEMPSRLFASRLADTVRLLQGTGSDASKQALLSQLNDARYTLRVIDAPSPEPAHSVAHQAVENLIAGVLAQRLHEPVTLHLLDVGLTDKAGDSGILTLFDSRMPSGRFHAQLQVPGGAWLDVTAREGQAGMENQTRALALDYVLRIYAIRFLAALGFAMVAVRIAVQPLRRFAQAAQALGRNVYRPALPLYGPREVVVAARSFNAMQQQLIRGIEERTRLLASISHDLRSPLTRLRLRTEMLPDSAARERLNADLDDMDAMVHTALDFARAVEVTEPRRQIDIDSLLRGLCDDLAETGTQVIVEGHAGAPISGYPRNLKRCLQNLLDNAIRHGTNAAVQVHDQRKAVLIVISDEGPGIRGDGMLERVFEPYVREQPGKTNGTGLGLTIAKSIAVAHGGTLELVNRPERGLFVKLCLPREAPA